MQRAISMAKKWGVKALAKTDLNEELAADIVSVCTPDNDHYSSLVKAVSLRPRLVVCEKPLTTSLKDSARIISLYKKNKIPLVVNYTRRFDRTVWEVKQEIEHGRYGNILGARMIYTKGLLHNGSHAIDLARFLLGEVISGSVLYHVNDYDKFDNSVGAFLRLEKCPQIYLIPADERKYSVFDLEILCAKGRISFNNFGFEFKEEKVVGDPLFKGYKMLAEKRIVKTKLNRALASLVDQAVDCLEKKTNILSSAQNAYVTQKICLSLLKNGKYVR